MATAAQSLLENEVSAQKTLYEHRLLLQIICIRRNEMHFSQKIPVLQG